MKTVIREVTPEVAKLWLEKNVSNNRNIRKSTVDMLVREIKEGR